VVAALVVITALGTVVQARMNGELVEITKNAPEIGMLNITLGLIVASVAIAASARLRARWQQMATQVRSRRLKMWEMLGGVGGVFFVTTQSACVPIIGVAVFTVAVVAGQTSNATLVDRLGLGPGGRQPVTPLRLLAVGVAIAAVAISVADRFDPTRLEDSRVALVFATLALLAGVASALQSALNGRVARAAGHASIAGWVNFAVGWIVGGVVLTLLTTLGGRPLMPLPLDRPWLLIGGVLGLVYVSTAAWAVRPLGILLTAVLSVVGLLGGALLIDIIAPTSGTSFGWHLVVGVALALCAAALAAIGRSRAA
jgi:transporter family-2 protein